jgi:hypothetical protein
MVLVRTPYWQPSASSVDRLELTVPTTGAVVSGRGAGEVLGGGVGVGVGLVEGTGTPADEADGVRPGVAPGAAGPVAVAEPAGVEEVGGTAEPAVGIVAGGTATAGATAAGAA